MLKPTLNVYSDNKIIKNEIKINLHKIGVLGISHSDNCMDFFDQLLFFIVIEVHVPLGQPSLPSTILNQDEPYLWSIKSLSYYGTTSGMASMPPSNIIVALHRPKLLQAATSL